MSWPINYECSEKLIRVDKLSQKGAPMIVLACKSDPEVPLEVDAAYGNSLGEPYNVGLIEVTALSAEGKSKMRNGLRWLLFKLEQRSRKPSLFRPVEWLTFRSSTKKTLSSESPCYPSWSERYRSAQTYSTGYTITR